MHFAKRTHPQMALLAGSMALLLAACSGSSNTTPPPPPAPTAPGITTQPASASVTLGATASFTVVASGTAPLAYQWSRNGAAITGATAASFATPATGLDDSGSSFTVTVSNGIAPNVTSAAATLTVTTPTGMSFDASAQVITPGEGVILTYTFPGSGTLQGNAISSGGTTVVYPTATTAYTLAWNDGAAHSATRTVVLKTYAPHHLYVVNGGSHDFGGGTVVTGSNTLSHFTVTTNEMANDYPVSLMIGAGVPTGKNPVHVVASPDEQRLYVANAGDDTVSGYALDPASGAATPLAGSPFASDPGPFASAFAPSGKFLYLGCADSVQVFSVGAAGALTAVAAQRVAITGRGNGEVLMHPSGRFLYVADRGAGAIKTYAVDRATGALTLTSNVSVSGGPIGLTFDRAGATLVTRGAATDLANNASLEIYAVDAYSGAATLTQHFEGFDSVNFGMPFVRGDDAGNHSLAFSRQPGLDIIYDAYQNENTWPSSMSAYWLDMASGGLPATNWEVGRGPWPYDPMATWATPISTDFWGSAGASVVLDRSGTLQVLTAGLATGAFYIYPVSSAGQMMGGMMGDYSTVSSKQASDGQGDFPSHAVFTGTLQ